MIDFQEYKLGMGRERVTLLGHNPRWFAAFRELSATLAPKLAGSNILLHHVGSTSIPGIRAKPILDLLGVVPSVEGFDSYRSHVEAAGFEWKGEYGIPGRRYSVLYDEGKNLSFVHLHVFAAGHPEAASHLRFRDRLREDPPLARKYDDLKEALVLKFAGERAKYTEAKAEFIQGVLGR